MGETPPLSAKKSKKISIIFWLGNFGFGETPPPFGFSPKKKTVFSKGCLPKAQDFGFYLHELNTTLYKARYFLLLLFISFLKYILLKLSVIHLAQIIRNTNSQEYILLKLSGIQILRNTPCSNHQIIRNTNSQEYKFSVIQILRNTSWSTQMKDDYLSMLLSWSEVAITTVLRFN